MDVLAAVPSLRKAGVTVGARLHIGARWFGWPVEHRPRDFGLREDGEPEQSIFVQPVAVECDEKVMRTRFRVYWPDHVVMRAIFGEDTCR